MSATAFKDTIAIVGIGCRLPGGIASPTDLWDMLLGGSSNITRARADRYPDVVSAGSGESGPHPAAGSGAYFAAEQLENFDAEFFGLSPREAQRIDPQHRLLLETAWESLEDAGIPLRSIEGGNGGVFIGQWTNDFEAQAVATADEVDLYSITGHSRFATSNRLSYKLGLQGPSLTIDSACSSSSVANHLACAAIRNGECDIALVGGVNVILSSGLSIAFDRAGILSPGDKLKFGDATADGYLRSEGAVVLVLKPMSSAVADGDKVYAAISGSAVNNDGTTGRYMTSPGVEGHKKVLAQAWQRAGIRPSDLAYVEAHGTGTIDGDRSELTALDEAFVDGGRSDSACPVGSIKPNIGHIEASSGVVGLAKAALILKHGIIPPTLNIDTPNPAVSWEAIRPVTEAEKLQTVDGVANIGVTCYGLGGTNVHTVLTSPPAPKPQSSTVPQREQRAWIVPLSARHPAALAEFAAALRVDLEQRPHALVDLAYSAAHRRSLHPHRAAIIATDLAHLQDGLSALAEGRSADNLFTGRAGPTATATAASGSAHEADTPESTSPVNIADPSCSADEVVLRQAAQQFTEGTSIRWPTEGRFVDLPRYRWQRRRAWPDDVGAIVRHAESHTEVRPIVGFGHKLQMLAHRPTDHVWQGTHPATEIDRWRSSPDVLTDLIRATIGEDLGRGPWSCQDIVVATGPDETADAVAVQLAVVGSPTPRFELSIQLPDGPDRVWVRFAHGRLERHIGYPLPAPVGGLLTEVADARRTHWLRDRVTEQVAISIGDKPSSRLDPNTKLSAMQGPAGFEETLRERLDALAGAAVTYDLADGSLTIDQLANRLAERLEQTSAGTSNGAPESSNEPSTDDLAKALSDLLNDTGTP